MRYIGNKTKLLPFIARALRTLRLAPGAAHDAFAGTASVGRALKAARWRVASSDLMSYSHVFQRAYVVASRTPDFADLVAADSEVRRHFAERGVASLRGRRALGAVAGYLSNALPPEHGFISTHFAPAGGRMYFTEENASRIDAVRRALHEWRVRGLIVDDAYYILLAALLEGADRVANTAGVYAAYIKSWQPNALRPITIDPEPPVAGVRGASAHLDDAVSVARQLGCVDLLYVDPPYNARQYPGYYHVPELIARGWFDSTPVLRGKTGLFGGRELRSAWCSTRRVRGALSGLLEATGARHVLVSYNSDGLLSGDELKAILRDASVDQRVRAFRKRYPRYRADRDHDQRRYRDDRLDEMLYYCRLR